MKNLMRNTC